MLRTITFTSVSRRLSTRIFLLRAIRSIDAIRDAEGGMRRADAVATVRIPAYVRLLPDHQRRTVLRPCAADWFPTFRIRLRGWGGETCEPDFIPTDSFHSLHIFRSANRKL